MRTYGYTRVKNNHIFVQFSVEQFSTIERIIAKKHQRIHIFDLYPVAITNCIQKIIDMADNTTTIVIHVPKMMVDYERVLGKKLTNDDDKKVKISIESKPVKFYFRHNSGIINSSSDELLDRFLEVGYSKDREFYRLVSYVCREVDRYMLGRGEYDLSSIAFTSVHQRRYPELFKDVILKNFMKNCPEGILPNFKNDDELWEYITWDEEEKGGSWYEQNSNR